MRNPLPTTLREATTARGQEFTIPRGRRPVPTHTGLHTRRIPVAMYVAALLLVPTLMVAGFMSAGIWTSAENSATTQAAQKGASLGESSSGAAALAAPADVKGSMTVQQVIDAFSSITAAQILAKLGAPMDTPTSTQLKTLAENGNSMDIPTLRTWLQEQGAK